jgi:hypothetical protein
MRCSVGLVVDTSTAGRSAWVDKTGTMEPERNLSGFGPQPEIGRDTLMKLACRYDAVRRRQRRPSSNRLRRAASDRQAHKVDQFRTFLAGPVSPNQAIPLVTLGNHFGASSAPPIPRKPAAFSRFDDHHDQFKTYGSGEVEAPIQKPPNNGLQLTRSARCALANGLGGSR